MTLRHLKIFAAVCREGGVTRAADMLSLAQPSVSFALAEMEKYYGVKLFERVNQRLVITETGKALYERANGALTAFTAFEESAAEAKAVTKLSFGSSLTIGQYITPRLIADITRKFPAVRLTVKINQARAVENMVLSGALDFGLIEGEPSSPALAAAQFSKDILAAVAGKDYPVKNNALSAESLKEQKLILREKGSAARDFLDRFLQQRGLTAEPYIESVSTPVIISCLINNLGVSFLPHSLIAAHIERGELKPLDFKGADFERAYNLITLKNKTFTKVQREVLETCLKF